MEEPDAMSPHEQAARNIAADLLVVLFDQEYMAAMDVTAWEQCIDKLVPKILPALAASAAKVEDLETELADHVDCSGVLIRTRLLAADTLAKFREKNDTLTAKLQASARALELPLLFHSGGIWTPEKSARWKEITGTEEATTKRMCDTIRAVLASPEARATGEDRA